MKTILIIEDDASVREGIKDLLNEEGYDVSEAENGKKGIDLAKKILPDLIISDILMPEKDGYSVLNEVREDARTASIPFIFLSARTAASDIRTGMNIGADDYITKPYKAQDLLNSVNLRINKAKVFDKKFDELDNNIIRSLPPELRTPLVSIIGFSQIIKEDVGAISSVDLKDFAEKINSAGYSLLEIIQKFFTHSEVESTLTDKNKRTSVKNEVLTNVKSHIEQHAVNIAWKFNRYVDLSFELKDASVKISRNYCQVIIEELVNNAIRFSNKNTPISISSRLDNDFYIITITDNGVGMSEQQIEDLGLLKQFNKDKYFQNGVGIGLSLVKKILELHTGLFRIQSEEGKYTSVEISIPLANNPA